MFFKFLYTVFITHWNWIELGLSGFQNNFNISVFLDFSGPWEYKTISGSHRKESVKKCQEWSSVIFLLKLTTLKYVLTSSLTHLITKRHKSNQKWFPAAFSAQSRFLSPTFPVSPFLASSPPFFLQRGTCWLSWTQSSSLSWLRWSMWWWDGTRICLICKSSFDLKKVLKFSSSCY